MLGADICKTLTQHWLNIVPMLVLNVGHWRSHNIHTMLPECCHWDNVQATLCERCVNIAAQPLEWCCHNIHTTLPEHCLNIVPQCWWVTLPQHSHNVAWTLPEHWPTLWQCCSNVGILVEIQCWDNIHTILSHPPHNIAETSKSSYIWTLLQHWDRRWGNIVTTLPQHWSITWVQLICTVRRFPYVHLASLETWCIYSKLVDRISCSRHTGEIYQMYDWKMAFTCELSTLSWLICHMHSTNQYRSTALCRYFQFYIFLSTVGPADVKRNNIVIISS